MTEAEVRDICLSFPGVTEGTSYGRPSFLVNKKFFTRLRREDDSLVLLEVGFDEREMLMEAEPARSTSPRTTKTIPPSLPGARASTLARSAPSSNAAGARSRPRAR